MTKNLNILSDSLGRNMRKLRVSLNDLCNFRCFYCMPEKPQFVSKSIYLSPSEIIRISRIVVEHGISEIRLTGGEPLLRKEFDEIASGLSLLPLKKFGLTTNGFYLQQKLDFLKDINCQHINVSMDSVDKDNFNEITRSRGFQKVYNSVIQAREMNFPIKINTVLMRKRNFHELEKFIEFSARTGIEVRFLEMMRIGQSQENEENFVAADEAITLLEKNHALEPIKVSHDSTSFKYQLSNGAIIGFIASESKPFCGSCSRLRLSFDGKLRACLMSEKGHYLKNKTEADIESLIQKTLMLKPSNRIHHVEQNMFEIGG